MMSQQKRYNLGRYRQTADDLLVVLRSRCPGLDIRVNPIGSVLPTEGGAYVECVVFVREDDSNGRR